MAYKAFKAVRGVPQGRDALRMMQKMGMQVKEVSGVEQVIIQSPGKRIIIESPNVTTITVQGQTMFQVAGGSVKEEAEPLQQARLEINEGDVRLVAEQAGVGLEQAKKALDDAGGDLAQAIIMLKKKQET